MDGILSVHLQLLSPLSQGLFQRAILQSCTALDPSWRPLTQETALIFSDLFSKAMGCDQNQVEVLKCLRNRDMADVMILSEVIEGTTKWMAVPDIDFTQGFIKHYLHIKSQVKANNMIIFCLNDELSENSRVTSEIILFFVAFSGSVWRFLIFSVSNR